MIFNASRRYGASALSARYRAAKNAQAAKLRSVLNGLLAGCFALAVAGCFSGCTGGDNTAQEAAAGSNIFLTPEQAEAEYFEAGKTLPLPDGEEYPQSRFTKEQVDVSFEQGLGEMEAFSHYACSWNRYYLANHNTDQVKTQTALDMITGFTSQPIFIKHFLDSGAKEIYDRMAEAASFGDPSKVAEQVELNCPDI